MNDIKQSLKALLPPDQLDYGLRLLDGVKHCDDKMNEHQKKHDSLMRSTPPLRWSAFDILQMEITFNAVNSTVSDAQAEQ